MLSRVHENQDVFSAIDNNVSLTQRSNKRYLAFLPHPIAGVNDLRAYPIIVIGHVLSRMA